MAQTPYIALTTIFYQSINELVKTYDFIKMYLSSQIDTYDLQNFEQDTLKV